MSILNIGPARSSEPDAPPLGPRVGPEVGPDPVAAAEVVTSAVVSRRIVITRFESNATNTCPVDTECHLVTAARLVLPATTTTISNSHRTVCKAWEEAS